MNRWRQEFHYLDHPTVVVEREDLYSLRLIERTHLGRGVWRADPPQRLHGPALSPDEYRDGLRVQRSGAEWLIYEPVIYEPLSNPRVSVGKGS